jgi:hypothetical protein
MPWTTNCLVHEQSLTERSIIMRALGTDREQLVATPDQE